MDSKRAPLRSTTGQVFFSVGTKLRPEGSHRGDTPNLAQPAPPLSGQRRSAPSLPIFTLYLVANTPAREDPAQLPGIGSRLPISRAAHARDARPHSVHIRSGHSPVSVQSSNVPANTRETELRRARFKRTQQKYAPMWSMCIFPPLPAPQSGLFSAVYIQDHTHVQNRIWCRCDAGHLKAWITLMFLTINP